MTDFTELFSDGNNVSHKQDDKHPDENSDYKQQISFHDNLTG
jgi:hypothetical protein